MHVSCTYELTADWRYCLWGLTSHGTKELLGHGTQVAIVFDSGTFSMIAHGIKDVVDDVMRKQRDRWRQASTTPMSVVQVTFPPRWPVDEINKIMEARTQAQLQPLLRALLDRATSCALEEHNEPIEQDPSRHALQAVEGHHAGLALPGAGVVQDQETHPTEGPGGGHGCPTEET